MNPGEGWSCGLWARFQKVVKNFILKSMIRVAKVSVTHPVKTIIVTLALSCATFLTGIFTNYYLETDINELFTPSNSEVAQYENWVKSPQSGFPKGSRKLEVVVHSMGDNVLSVEGIRHVFEVVDLVKSTEGYEDLCQLHEGGKCDILSPTGFWRDHNSTLFEHSVKSQDYKINKTLSQLYFVDATPVFRPSIFGQAKPEVSTRSFLFFQGLGKYELGDSLWKRYELESSRAFIVSIFLPPVPDSLPFETKVTENLLFLADEWKSNPSKQAFGLEHITTSSFDNDSMRGVFQDIPLIAVAFVTMGVFCAATLGKWHPVRSQSLLGLGAVFAIFLALVTGYGILFMAGVPLTGVTQAFPYILVGVGLDSIYIITGAFARTNKRANIVVRVEEAVNEVGISIFVGNLTTVVAFGLGGFASIPSFRYFAAYAAPTVFIDFLFKLTFFFAILSLDEERQKSRRRDCCPCFHNVREMDSSIDSTLSTENDDDSLDNMSSSIEKYPKHKFKMHKISISFDKVYTYYVNFLLWTPGKVMILFFFSLLLSLGILGALQQNQQLDFRDSLPDDSYVRNYFNSIDNYVATNFNPVPVACYFRNIDVSKEENQESIMKYINDLVALPYISSQPPMFWLRDFLRFSSRNNETHRMIDQNLSFYEQLDVFLSIEPYSTMYKDDVVLNKDRDFVTASRVRIIYDGVNWYDTEMSVQAFKDVTAVTEAQPMNEGYHPKDWNMFIYGHIHNVWVLYDDIIKEVIKMVVIGLFAVFLISSVFLPHMIGPIVITIVVAMIYIELLAVLYVAGISINTISAIVLNMSIGLVVDYNMHIICTYFEIQNEATRNDRIRKVFFTMGESVLLGGASTFCGALPLAFSSTAAFYAFFVTVLGLVTLGVGHGMLFTPVVLSLIAPHEKYSPPLSKQIDAQSSHGALFQQNLDGRNVENDASFSSLQNLKPNKNDSPHTFQFPDLLEASESTGWGSCIDKDKHFPPQNPTVAIDDLSLMVQLEILEEEEESPLTTIEIGGKGIETFISQRTKKYKYLNKP